MTIQRFDVGTRLSEMAVHGGVCYLAGQVAPDGSQDIRGQTTQVLAAIDARSAAEHWNALEEEHYHRYLTGELDYLGQRRARARGFVERHGLEDHAVVGGRERPGRRGEHHAQVLGRIGLDAEVLDGALFGTRRVSYRWHGAPLVSIVIPTRDREEYLRPLVESLQERTRYPNYEVLIVDNDSSDPDTLRYMDRLLAANPDGRVRVLPCPGEFSWAASANTGAAAASVVIGATEPATDTFFCCSGCGMRVRTTEMESHSGFGGWCEADVRRRNGDPPPDQHEVRLRGLVVVRGTREDVDNLANFRASKGMA